MTKPSVTTVLGKFSDFSQIRPDVLAHAAERGTAVHDALHVFIEGSFACPSREAQGYFDSGRRWVDKMLDTVIIQETRLHCDEFHGKPDLIAVLKDGTTALIDWKTPAQPAITWPIQIAAYRLLARQNGEMTDRGMCIRLRKNGAMPIVDEYTNFDQNINTWWACLTVYQTFYGDK